MALIEGKVDMGHVRPLLTLAEEQQVTLLNTIINEQLAVRQAEKLAGQRFNNEKMGGSEFLPKNQDVETKWKAKLPKTDWLKLQFSKTRVGHGKLIRNFSSEDELQFYIRHIEDMIR